MQPSASGFNEPGGSAVARIRPRSGGSAGQGAETSRSTSTSGGRCLAHTGHGPARHSVNGNTAMERERTASPGHAVECRRTERRREAGQPGLASRGWPAGDGSRSAGRGVARGAGAGARTRTGPARGRRGHHLGGQAQCGDRRQDLRLHELATGVGHMDPSDHRAVTPSTVMENWPLGSSILFRSMTVTTPDRHDRPRSPTGCTRPPSTGRFSLKGDPSGDSWAGRRMAWWTGTTFAREPRGSGSPSVQLGDEMTVPGGLPDVGPSPLVEVVREPPPAERQPHHLGPVVATSVAQVCPPVLTTGGGLGHGAQGVHLEGGIQIAAQGRLVVQDLPRTAAASCS